MPYGLARRHIIDGEQALDHPLHILHRLGLEEGKQHLQQHCIAETQTLDAGTWLEQEALEKLYDPFVSLKLAELLIFLGQYARNRLLYALGLKARGDALVQVGHYRAALDSLDEAGTLFLQAEDERNWARSRISWIVACAWLGNTDGALRQAEQARAVFERLEEPVWACSIDNNIAVIYSYAGRYQETLAVYERMRASYAQLAQQDDATVARNVALVDLNQAVYLSWLGDFDQAYALQDRARDLLHALGEPYLEQISEINTADLDYGQGYYGSALRRYYYALDSLRATSDAAPLLLAELKLVIARCLIKLNRAEEARILAGEATAIYQTFDISLNTILALITQATAQAACGLLEQAIETLTEAQAFAVSGSFNYLLVAVQLQKAELLLEIGDASDAYEQANLLRQTCDAWGLVTSVVRAELVMAHALFVLAGEGQDFRIDEAARLCAQIVRIARKHNLQEAIYKGYHLLGHLALLHGRRREAGRYYQAAVLQIERILVDLVYDLSPAFLRTAWTIYADTVEFFLAQKQGQRALYYLENARSIALRQYLQHGGSSTEAASVHQEVRLMLTRLQRELKDWQEKYHEYGMLLSQLDTSVSTTVDPATLQAEFARCEREVSERFERFSLYQEEQLLARKPGSRRKRLPARAMQVEPSSEEGTGRQVLLEYFMHREKLVIFALHDGQLTWHTLPDGVQRLEKLLPFLDARLQSGRWKHLVASQQRGIRNILRELYMVLINPVADLLKEAELLTIVPYGPLHSLPFHALYDGSHFLIEQMPIRYLPSSSLSEPSGKADSTASRGRPLLFGYSAQGQLPYVSEEVGALAALLQGTHYLEQEATIARLLQEAPGSPVMHIATHGHYRWDAPNFSSVLLADGRLNAIDVFNLNLRGCELVTLSGCETGLAVSTGGDEQLGLGRAFLAAGVETLVMSLWPVEDQATTRLMGHFYRALLRGESKVQSLRTAQRALLAEADADYAHPYYWAPFRLVGASSPLKWQREASIEKKDFKKP